MPVIDIHHQHTGSIATTRTALERVACELSSNYGLAHEWHGDELRFKRSGVKGRIAIGAYEVHVHIELGMLMAAMKPIIEREIGRQLEQHLA